MNMTNQANDSGMKGAKSLLIGFIILALILFAFALINKSAESKIMNYESCAQSKGSRIIETYPQTCITADKHSFINPAEQRQCGRAGWATNPQLCR
jgi:hypothetical protein